MALLGLRVLLVSRVCLTFLVLLGLLGRLALLGLRVLLLLFPARLGLPALRVRRVRQVRKVTLGLLVPRLPFLVLWVRLARRVTLGIRDLLVPKVLRAIRVVRVFRASRAFRVFLAWVFVSRVRSLTLLSCRMTLCRATCGCWAIVMTRLSRLRLSSGMRLTAGSMVGLFRAHKVWLVRRVFLGLRAILV
jgi:hypothetical protein